MGRLVAPGAGIDAVEGIEWHLTSLPGAEIPAEADATLLLESGASSGFAGCNRFNGGYTVDGHALSFGPMSTTLMSCGPHRDQLEMTYLARLGEVSGFEVTDTELRLTAAGGDILLQFISG